MLQESTRDLGLQVAATVRVLGECLRACLRIYKGACFHRNLPLRAPPQCLLTVLDASDLAVAAGVPACDVSNPEARRQPRRQLALIV